MNGPLVVGDSQAGLIKFALPQAGGEITRAFLALTFLPGYRYQHDIALYGFGSAVSGLTSSDGVALLSATQPLSTFHIDASLADVKVYFEVTSFVRGQQSPFLVFGVTSTSIEVLGSLETADGSVALLQLTRAVPEPSEAALMFAGLLGLAAWLRGRQPA